MGAARAKKSRNVRLLEQHPYCVYCGGTTKATQVDHAPPIAIFTLRRRPEGLEFPACSECHAGTRPLDVVASFYARLYPNPETEAEEQELIRLYRGMINTVPIIGLENAINADRTADYAHTKLALEKLGPGQPRRIMGPWVRRYLDAFFARLALALHYQETGTVLPASGTVRVRTFSNTALLRGDLPPPVLAAFGGLRALVQKGLNAEKDFSFASCRLEADDETATFVNFRHSMAGVSLCVPRQESNRDGWSHYSPGFLRDSLVR